MDGNLPNVQHPRYQLHAVLGRLLELLHVLLPNTPWQCTTTGKGASGIVVLAKDVDSARPVAIKLLERGPQVNDYTDREAFTHRLLNHPHIVKMKVRETRGMHTSTTSALPPLQELFLTRHYLGIVLDYANLGDLFRYVTSRTRLTENQARCGACIAAGHHIATTVRNVHRWFFQQLMVSVDYLHRKMEIAHRYA